LEISINVPNNNSPYEVEVVVSQTDCSRCASGKSNPQEATGICTEQAVFQGGQLLGYDVARPRWNQTTSYNNYIATRNITGILPDYNMPNSCGCRVPL
jgi:hypothetical protein